MQAGDCIFRVPEGTDFLSRAIALDQKSGRGRPGADSLFSCRSTHSSKKTQFHRNFPENIGASHQIWEVPKRDSALTINGMSNSRAPVKQSEITRAVRGVLAAGIQVGKVVVGPDGRVEIFPVGAVPAGEDGSANPCDVLLAGRCA